MSELKQLNLFSKGLVVTTERPMRFESRFHYDFNTDKMFNSLRIPVLIDTSAMRR